VIGKYQQELEQFEETYRAALAWFSPGTVSTSGDRFRSAITSASQSSLIGVGSGGSFTVASLLCNLHEAYTGQVSRPSTPLEIICNPTLAASSPAVFVSAEGKNPDIVEALVRARQRSSRAIHVFTNREMSPLTETADRLRDVVKHVFPLAHKDGYLATNSLLLDSLLVAKAYEGLQTRVDCLPPLLTQLELNGRPIDAWSAELDAFARQCATREALVIIYSPNLRPIAADLESKFSESAMNYIQLSDLRSFAHGRHLWLSERPADCAVVAVIDTSLEPLWSFTHDLMPKDVPTLKIGVDNVKSSGMIAALVAALRLVGALARVRGIDPGRPNVASFGGKLYYADLPSLVANSNPEAVDSSVQEKLAVLGTRWPYGAVNGTIHRARVDYSRALSQRFFKAVVFDYDGTLRTPQQEDGPPPPQVVEHLNRLLDAQITVAIVSGRGKSLQKRVREVMPTRNWGKVNLCLYNGGWIGDLAKEVSPDARASELLNHVARLANRLMLLGVPILTVKVTQPYQVSIRFKDGVDTADMWFVFADELRSAGLDVRTIVRSRHSIDVLSPDIGKASIIAKLVSQFGMAPQQILTIGDQGAWPGNDWTLLEHKWSISVDLPSRRLDRGWKLAPAEKRGVDACLWYMENMILSQQGAFSVTF
jgi:hypothetical protein